MPSTSFPIPALESFMPSVDARMSGATHVIGGRNFLWDSKGPLSGFGASILTPFPIEKPTDIQMTRVQGRSLTFTQDAIMSWRMSPPYSWELHYQFDSPLTTDDRNPWQVIYLAGKLALAHPTRGFFTADYVTGQNQLWIKPRIAGTAPDIPGLPSGVKGMVVVRGRAILVNDDTIYWSGVSDLEDFTPALAGPGFHRIDETVSGTYVALTSYQNGFIVWTTKGAVIAEFIGGDETWRFDPLISQERPLSPWCTLELSNGNTVMLTSHGLFVAPDAPQPWTPNFNEFFRTRVQQQPGRGFFFRIEYDFDAETIYILEAQNGIRFNKAYALKPTLDKWGTFDVPCYGMGQLTYEDFGYVDFDGIPRVFRDQYFREIMPAESRGFDRHYPLHQKQMVIPSSTARSRALTYDPAHPDSITDVTTPGWYARNSFLQAPPEIGGMDSWIEVGYLFSSQLSMSADAFAEFQEITILGTGTKPTQAVDFTTAWNEEFFYPETEDWNYSITLTPADVIVDFMVEDDEIDFLSDGNELIDLLYASANAASTFDSPITEDWNLDGPSEDWGGSAADYPPISHKISIHSSQDGFTVVNHPVELAKFNIGAKEYVTMTSGTLHYLRFEATDPYEWFHIRGINLTMYYGGQQT